MNATGPEQSWGATGRWYVSASAAILRASVNPPHQEMSGMAMPQAPVSSRSRNSHLPPSVSLTQIGTRVLAA